MTHELFWRALEYAGTERLRVMTSAEGLLAHGVAVGRTPECPYAFDYRVRLDEQGRCRRLGLQALLEEWRLELTSDGEGNWQLNGVDREDLAGCIDIDLAFTPFSNSLPIRRYNWSAGDTCELAVVHLTLPEMKAHPARQRYTCREPGYSFDYHNLDSGYESAIMIDGDGWVIEYPGLFRREAT
ncbi:putative glycolipid-binding domain-containing protein [Kushneria phosphatilytica]|uniref:Putative glycolipid-binding domain-containing protein n=1 Tax=Kushneria phosphatilytica TaxID=657387 RepID=A0A1S1P1K2_9GAMM|nr:putative glycolipid-binding domain-containing protein [Kushneria phosphatilytica]OHV13937.1 hypothetical protein BH688_00905 [Kushneria phosphatilytica]QEL10500.1 putative glycolipid-binding domain-containing protein [Kushneria phosphatilytica]